MAGDRMPGNRLTGWLRRRPRLALMDMLAATAPNDYRGVPTRECVCGTDLIFIPVVFDEDREIAGYVNTGFCAVCGSMVTVPCNTDDERVRWS